MNQFLFDRGLEELTLAGAFEGDGATAIHVQELLKVFCEQEHEDVSAAITAEVFHTLADGGVLTPLTGNPEEWETTRDNRMRNKRCFHVFTEDGGITGVDIRGRVFITKEGQSFQTGASHTDIKFPYKPKVEFIREGTPEAEKYKSIFEFKRTEK